ncbi:hypothetical protein J6590_071545, partial [Homalodisca vitripennis]
IEIKGIDDDKSHWDCTECVSQQFTVFSCTQPISSFYQLHLPGARFPSPRNLKHSEPVMGPEAERIVTYPGCIIKQLWKPASDRNAYNIDHCERYDVTDICLLRTTRETEPLPAPSLMLSQKPAKQE